MKKLGASRGGNEVFAQTRRRQSNKTGGAGELLGQDDAVELGLEPVDGVVLGETVVGTDAANGALSAGNAVPGTAEDNEKVHAVDADGGIVLDAQVDVFLDAEAEVAGGRKVLLLELVLLDLEALLEDLLGLGAADGAVDGNFFVATDGEGADGVAGLGVDGGLAGELLEDLGSTGEAIARLAHGNVQAQLLDVQRTHRVILLALQMGR